MSFQSEMTLPKLFQAFRDYGPMYLDFMLFGEEIADVKRRVLRVPDQPLIVSFTMETDPKETIKITTIDEYTIKTESMTSVGYHCGRCAVDSLGAMLVGAPLCRHIPTPKTSDPGFPYFKVDQMKEVLPPLPLESQYVGAVRMFRLWTVPNYANPKLKALVQEHIWSPGENRATKVSSGTGGFYGFKSLRELVHQEGKPDGNPRIAGTILAYGRIKQGTMGARAQYAIVESLILPEYLRSSYDPDVTLKWHRGLAMHYQCPLITWSQAEDLATGLVPYKKPEPK
jgi:hypothetical protein